MKTKLLIFCLISVIGFAALFSLAACGDGGANQAPANNGTVTEVKDQEENLPDASKLNIFSMSQTGKSGDEVTAKLFLGGEYVKLCGFKITLVFDDDVKVKKVTTSRDFDDLIYNKENSGKLVLLWAVTVNVEKPAEVCEITFDLSGASSYEVTAEIGSLGYYDTVNYRVRNVTAAFKPFNFNA